MARDSNFQYYVRSSSVCQKDWRTAMHLNKGPFKLGLSFYRKFTGKSVKLFYRFTGKKDSVNFGKSKLLIGNKGFPEINSSLIFLLKIRKKIDLAHNIPRRHLLSTHNYYIANQPDCHLTFLKWFARNEKIESF
jgi:hypothetical protein